jgi:metal-dependent amidase/aminoacylase/carboxypeptidase family protein
MPIKNLLFIDTNIWLDCYSARNEMALKLIERAETVSDRLTLTYPVEIEFKKNRQAAIREGLQQLKPPDRIPHPGIFSDAKATQMMAASLKETGKSVEKLRKRLLRALEDPTANDEVYQIFQRLLRGKRADSYS